MRFKLDDQVRDRILADARGNPLALLELPRGLSATELAGFGTGAMSTVPTGLEENFRRRIGVLPEETRRLLLIAAADPLGDAVLVRRAAELCGITAEAAAPAVEAGLCEFGARIRFRHPLVRAAAYGLGSQMSGGRRMRRSPRQQIRQQTPTAGRGIAPSPRRGQMRPSRTSSSSRPFARGHAEVRPPRLRFSSARWS